MSNTKATIYKVPLSGEEAGLNLNSFKADIHQFQLYNEKNAPFYDGTLSPVYYKKEKKTGEVIIDKNYNEYTIDSDGIFYKNGTALNTLSPKKFTRTEITISNLRDYFDTDLYITETETDYTLYIGGSTVGISTTEKPSTYLYKYNNQYCAIVGNTAYYKNTTSGSLITKEIYDIDYLSVTPTSYDGLCIAYVSSLNSIVYQSKQFFCYVSGGTLVSITKPSSTNYVYLTQDGNFSGFKYEVDTSKHAVVTIYSGLPTLTDTNEITIPVAQTNTLQTKRLNPVDYTVTDSFEGFTAYGNYSSFSPYFTIYCNEPTAVNDSGVYTMHYIADAYLGTGNFGLMRYYSVDSSTNVQYPFGYYVTDGNWRVLCDKGVIRNVSYAEDETYRGTIINSWDTIDIDKNVYIENDTVTFCNSDTQKWYQIKVEAATPELSYIGSRHIIINTTNYYNAYDTETGLFHHIADDWNNRVSPDWIDPETATSATITINVKQNSHWTTGRKETVYNVNYTVTITVDTILIQNISFHGCTLKAGETTATITKNASSTWGSSFTISSTLSIGGVSVQKYSMKFSNSDGTKLSTTYSYLTSEGYKDSSTVYTASFSLLETGMATTTIATAVNPMYTVTNVPYASMIQNPVTVFIPRTITQYSATANASMENKPAIKYGYYGDQMIDLFIDTNYSWSVFNKEYAKNTEATTKYVSLDSNCTIRDTLEGTTYPVDTNGNIYYNFPIFFDYIETTTNQDMISMNGTAYSMAYYSNQLILLYLMDTASSFYGMNNAFIVQGTNYAVANGRIVKYVLENGAVSSSEICLSVDGLQYIAATPYQAIFWSPSNKTFYSFTGDRNLTPMMQAGSITTISSATCYNPSTGSVLIPTDTGLIISSNTGMFRLKNYEADDELEVTDCKVFITKDGIAFTTDSYIYYFSYNRKDGYTAYPIMLQTEFYGLGNNMMSVNDTVYLRLYDETRSDGYVKISAVTLTNVGKEVEKKEYKIASKDWDNLTDTVYIRYQPKYQRSTGVSYKIETNCRIADFSIGNIPDVVQIGNKNF